jgi:hypothetical protein
MFVRGCMMASMKNRNRLWTLDRAVASIALLSCAFAWAAGDTKDTTANGDPQLLGCWRAERVEQTLPDGRVWTDVGGCTLKFEAQHITSACVLRADNQPIRYSYQIVAADTYRARIVDHPARQQAVGSERDYLYRIEADRLFITTYPQTASPAPMSRAVKVQSVSIKVGSATDLQSRGNQELAGCDGRLVMAPAPTPTPTPTSTPSMHSTLASMSAPLPLPLSKIARLAQAVPLP